MSDRPVAFLGPPVTPNPAILSADETNRILQCLPELYALGDMTTFPTVSLRIINQLLPTFLSTYNEIDLRTGAARIFYEPASFEAQGEQYKPGLWTHRHEHPLMQRYENNLNDGVVKISDYLSPEQLHGLTLYKEVLQPMGVEDSMSFMLQSSLALKVFYALNAPQSFTERDRAVAALLQPHLVQSFENAVSFTDARALALLSSRALDESRNYGLILADNHGRIVYANERAGLDLTAAFPGQLSEMLPHEIRQRITQRGPELLRAFEPLEVNTPARSFLFRAARADSGHWFIASRENDASEAASLLKTTYRLTDRQSVILVWLARGKTGSRQPQWRHAQGGGDRGGVVDPPHHRPRAGKSPLGSAAETVCTGMFTTWLSFRSSATLHNT